ncbi:hypothetical protein [Streptomyces sp. NBC_01198]|uniref:hypothetical protein n=1 Tax=Streptomyces sp. NBC_01198 TaxID=2903769 RepID=UPI002E136E69|nr:hypothetical protein OG702_04880 [Streptomyces sp. NBC_01198]
MATILLSSADEGAPGSGTVLVIGKSELALTGSVELIRANGRIAGATNDFDNVTRLFDAGRIDVVVFGGMVPPSRKESLREIMARLNPAIVFVQGLAGIPGLIAEQVEATLGPVARPGLDVTYDPHARQAVMTLDAEEHVRVVAFWHTAFVPPDPSSTSRVIFDDALPAGSHRVGVPDDVPTVASFLVVHLGESVYPFVVGPMPEGLAPAAPTT